ncbi:signal transduction histidine kinase [Stackebrandtia albiflava]|uniref:histidine kinase n=1 Tax=Stackebrandtia albiflava TaxID=406432 RepID=A0A562VEU4_9ACTN|nr:histidine kinase [Stackebrandtia albiflava]TWJ16351.1 signal transduction histidine kinase [Stackebrandtia albiflava]
MILRPLTSAATYRGWLWLIVGGGLVMPFMLGAEVVRIAIWGGPTPTAVMSVVDPVLFLACLPVVALAGALLPIRPASAFLARTLLGATGLTETGRATGWADRSRQAGWLLIHLGVGGVLSGVTLALVPFLALVALLPVLPDRGLASGVLAGLEWQAWWGPIIAPVAAAGLVYVVAGTGTVLRRAAERMLGPSAADRLAASRARERRLAERNRIARELHDSVGHALSVVTVQAEAADRVFDTDPEFTRRALRIVAETARDAVAELDQVLEVLRDETTHHAGPGLSALPRLLAESGLRLTTRIPDPMPELPVHLSREAYRIVQESVTNALRYGDGSATVTITETEGWLRIEVVNPIGAAGMTRAGGGGGFGLAGLTERAAILGGEVHGGPRDGRWRVSAALPLRSAP